MGMAGLMSGDGKRGGAQASVPASILDSTSTGAGMQVEILDLDGDGDLDLVFAGKSGQYWFENLLIDRVPKNPRDLLFNRYPSRQ